MKIKVVNKYHLSDTPEPGVTRVPIHRGTPLGNPFVMKDRSDLERQRVCDSFEEWVQGKLFGSTAQVQYFEGLVNIARDPSVGCIELVCFCSPKRCHGDTIKRLIEETLAKEAEGK